jgi:hypothetical protein
LPGWRIREHFSYVMTWGLRIPCRLAALGFLSGACAVAEDGRLATPAATTNNATLVEFRGQLLPVQEPVTNATFRTDSGANYTLISNRLSSALFLDTNLQSRTLLLGGRVLPGKKAFEVTRNFRSIRGGRPHELYYYCDICAIKGIEPGPCMCCREPVVLVEEPVEQVK